MKTVLATFRSIRPARLLSHSLRARPPIAVYSSAVCFYSTSIPHDENTIDMGKSKFELKTPKGTKDCKGPNYPSPAITTLFATDDHHKRLRIDQNTPQSTIPLLLF